MGGGELRVPEGAEVQVAKLAIMGGNDVRLDDRPVPAGAPVIHVRLLTIMAGFKVRQGPKAHPRGEATRARTGPRGRAARSRAAAPRPADRGSDGGRTARRHRRPHDARLRPTPASRRPTPRARARSATCRVEHRPPEHPAGGRSHPRDRRRAA